MTRAGSVLDNHDPVYEDWFMDPVDVYNYSGSTDRSTGATVWSRSQSGSVEAQIEAQQTTGEAEDILSDGVGDIDVDAVIFIPADTGIAIHEAGVEGSKPTEIDDSGTVYAVIETVDEGNGLLRLVCTKRDNMRLVTTHTATIYGDRSIGSNAIGQEQTVSDDPLIEIQCRFRPQGEGWTREAREPRVDQSPEIAVVPHGNDPETGEDVAIADVARAGQHVDIAGVDTTYQLVRVVPHYGLDSPDHFTLELEATSDE